MIITLYILKSANNEYYTGITKDMDRRIQEHTKGYCYSTKNFKNISIIYQSQFQSYKEARKEEIKVKRTGARKYLLKLKYS